MNRKQLAKTTDEYRKPLKLRIYLLVAITRTRPQLRPSAFTITSSVELLISNQQHGEDVVEKKMCILVALFFRFPLIHRTLVEECYENKIPQKPTMPEIIDTLTQNCNIAKDRHTKSVSAIEHEDMTTFNSSRLRISQKREKPQSIKQKKKQNTSSKLLLVVNSII